MIARIKANSITHTVLCELRTQGGYHIGMKNKMFH